MLITYDVKDTQILIVAPAPAGEESAFTCEVPDSLVAEYIAARKSFNSAMGALERAIDSAFFAAQGEKHV